MKIIFFTNNLGKGGAENVFSQLVEFLANDYQICVVSIHPNGYYEEFIKGLNVEFITLDGNKNNTFKYISRFRKIIKTINPEIVFSFLWYPNIINSISNIINKRKVILSERSNHRIYLKSTKKKKYLWKPILRLAYKRANLIIPNSFEMGDFISEDFNISREKIKVIHNGINYEKIEKQAVEFVDDFDFREDSEYLIAVGRLFSVKNYFYLLETFVKVFEGCPKAELIILGEGELELSLKKRVEELNISKLVHFLGYKSNPHKYVRNSQIYVMSSSVEGFPNALLEGMYINGHVVSTDCKTGPSEIISDGIDGFLVPLDNTELFAKKIIELIHDKTLRDKFYQNSRLKMAKFDALFMLESFKLVIDEI